MRLVHAAALTAAALLLASVASAQGLGDAAAREREKRKAAPAKPAKVYTEGDIGRSMAPVETTQDLPATAEAGAEARGKGPDPRDFQMYQIEFKRQSVYQGTSLGYDLRYVRIR